MTESIQTIEILGVKVYTGTMAQVLHTIETVLTAKKKQQCRYICATSVHGVIEAQKDTHFRNILNDAYINHPDGLPLRKVGQILGQQQMEQIKGPDLFLEVCHRTSKLNVSHFFYGGNEGVAEDLAERMEKKYSGLQVAGTHCPPFRPLTELEKEEIISKINSSEADIVWVGISTPKQERWMAEFRGRLNAKLIFSVGAAFDFHTERLNLVPPIMHKFALEWLYRLYMDPKRLWKRYMKIVPSFLFLAGIQVIQSRFVKQPTTQ